MTVWVHCGGYRIKCINSCIIIRFKIKEKIVEIFEDFCFAHENNLYDLRYIRSFIFYLVEILPGRMSSLLEFVSKMVSKFCIWDHDCYGTFLKLSMQKFQSDKSLKVIVSML